MITYSVGGVQYYPKTWKFPAGEVGVNVAYDAYAHTRDLVTIRAALTSSDDIMQLLMLTDALRSRYYNADISLVLGYTPYGRQDRRCNDGDSLSVRVFAQLINSQGYRQVTVIDPHSAVTEACIDRCKVMTQSVIFSNVMQRHIPYEMRQVIAAPDAGAAKKVKEIFDMAHIGFDSMVVADKVRDMETGHITEYTFSGDVKGKHVVVVDDICDGGATFLLMGKKLKEAGAESITLCVTHGIFTQGTARLTEMYDAIITTNSYHKDRVGLIDDVLYCEVL